MTPPLTDEQLKAFHADGFVVVEPFYHPTEIEPIQRGIHTIIGLVASEKHEAVVHEVRGVDTLAIDEIVKGTFLQLHGLTIFFSLYT